MSPPSHEEQATLEYLFEGERVRLLSQILASDTGALSLRELEWRANIMTVAEIEEELETLIETGLARVIQLDETPPDEIPERYYAASPHAIELLKKGGVWDGLGILWQIYDAMDRPTDIQRIEEWDGRPKPDWLPDPDS